MKLSSNARAGKLEKLAQIEGRGVASLLERVVHDSASPGICTNDGCDYTTEVEPDQDQGYCEACATQTVMSALLLAGLI